MPDSIQYLLTASYRHKRSARHASHTGKCLAAYARIVIVAFLLLAGLQFFVTPLAHAAESGKGGQMRVVYGYDREFPPFSFEESGGVPAGFEVELVQAIFHGTGALLSYRPLQWDRLAAELSNGTITLATGMVQTEERSRLYLFSQRPTFSLQIRLFTKVYNRFPSTAMLRGHPVAVQQGTFQHRLLERFGGMNIKTFPGRADGLRALYRDEATAYCAPVQNTYYLINKLQYGAITTVGTPLGTTDMRAAVTRSRGDVLRMVNEGLARVMASGEYHRLYRKWFVRELTPEEEQVLAKEAQKAAIPAYTPYGGQGAGASVLAATGKLYSACTVQNADAKLSLSAVRAAVAKAVAEGDFELRAAVVCDANGKITRLSREDLIVLHEFNPGALVILPQKQGDLSTLMASQLLATMPKQAAKKK